MVVIMIALALAGLHLVDIPRIEFSSFRIKRPMTSLQRTNAEARFLAALASELRAGATLRGALTSAVERAPELNLAGLVRLSAAGMPIADLAAEIRERLTSYGLPAASALRVAGETGGRTAAMFESLAQVAAEDRALHRELRAATAQAKVSALIVGGLPVLFLMWQVVSGRIVQLASTPIGAGILAVGLGLLAVGALTVVVMLRKATR